MTYGLPPRPELCAEEMAALVLAAQEMFKTPVDAGDDQAPSWRFSGRWFNAGPYVLRRPHRLN